MPDRQFATDRGDEVAKVGAMADVRKERKILFIDRLPISAVHFGVVEIFALNPPCLPVYLRPLGAGVNPHLELRHVDRPVAHFGGAVCGDDSPTISTRLVKELLLVSRERV